MLNLEGYDYTLDIDQNGTVAIFRDDDFVKTLDNKVSIGNVSTQIQNIHDSWMEDKRVKLNKLQELECEANQLRKELGLSQQVITSYKDAGCKDLELKDLLKSESDKESKSNKKSSTISFKQRKPNRIAPKNPNRTAPKNEVIEGRKLDVTLSAYGYKAVWSWNKDWEAEVTLEDGKITFLKETVNVFEQWDETEWKGTKTIRENLIYKARTKFLYWVWSDPMNAEEHLDFFTEEDIRLECSDKEREAHEAFFEAEEW